MHLPYVPEVPARGCQREVRFLPLANPSLRAAPSPTHSWSPDIRHDQSDVRHAAQLIDSFVGI
jgi:hypothetical protein